jgi:hypothetical protein
MEQPESFTWSREKIKEVLSTLTNLPDFDQLLFPESWKDQYSIPMTETKCHDLKTYLIKHKQIRMIPTEFVVHESTERTTRPVPEEEPLKLIVNSVPCTDELPFGVSAPPIEDNGTTQPENQDESSTDLPPLESAE